MKTGWNPCTNVPPEYWQAMKEGAQNGGPAPGSTPEVCYPDVPRVYWKAMREGAQNGGAAPTGIGRSSYQQQNGGWGQCDVDRLHFLEGLVSGQLGPPPNGFGHGPGERLRSLEEFVTSRFGATPADLFGHGPGERLQSLEEFIRSRFG